MKAMMVSVTKYDICNGKRDFSNCPVALAVQRATGDYGMRVDSHSIWKPYNSSKYHAPRSVSRFVNRYDSHKPVSPFRFILREV